MLAVMLALLLIIRFTAFRPGRVPDDLLRLAAGTDSLQGAALRSEPPSSPFTFDPNTVSYSDLLQLGLTDRQAATLINYRNAGARFRKPEHLSRVYGIDSVTAARLIPYIVIDTRSEVSSLAGVALDDSIKRSRTDYGRPGSYRPDLRETAPPRRLTDLNRCSAAELESLPGIGPVLAARIIRYRGLLGGFADSRQLAEVYGLDSSVVRAIIPLVTANPDSVAHLVLDSIEFSELAHHPYVGYETARLITRFRDLTDAPLTLGSMVRAQVITADQATRLAPYVRPSAGITGTDYEFISPKVLK